MYNSGGTTPSAVETSVWGSQWRGFYDRSIAYDTDGTISTANVKRANGKQYYFNLSSSVFVGDADVVGSLVRTGVDGSGNPTGWTYTNENDEVETYDANGRLTAITNRAGLNQTLTYSDGTSGSNGGFILDASGTATAATLPQYKLIRVSDPAGRTLQYGYDSVGRVVKMTDPIGGTYIYTYSDSTTLTANLTSVTYPDSNVRSYLYGESGHVSTSPATGVSYDHSLTGIQETGIKTETTRYASWTYDAQGRATSSEHGAFNSGIDHVGLSYGTIDSSGNSTTSVTDVNSVTRTYNFSTILGVVKNTGIAATVPTTPCNGCTATFTYDTSGNVKSRTDFLGNTTCYKYDVRNLENYRMEGLAPGVNCPSGDLSSATPSTNTGSVQRKISTTWNSAYRLPAQIAEPLRITTYVYNGDTVSGSAVICGHKADGTTLIPGVLCRKTIQATTDTDGRLGSGATTSGTARVTNYTYDTAGQIESEDGPRTDVTDTTNYTYYLLNATCSGSSSIGCRGQLYQVTNALSQVTTTLSDYDANGRPQTVIDPNGLVINLTYDTRGRLWKRRVGGVAGVGGELTIYTYNAAGNLTGVTLPGNSTPNYIYSYDDDLASTAAAHRLTRITDNHLGNYINYTLDKAGNREKEEIFDSTNTRVQLHSHVFNNLNQLSKDLGAYSNIVNNTGEITTYTYDDNFNLKTIIDPLNQTVSPPHQTTNFYDALNRLIQTTDPESGITGYGYDAQDQLVSVTDPKTFVTQYTRDGLGNLTQQVSPDTGTGSSASTFDAAGNLKTRTDAKSQTASYSYDALNRLTGISYTHSPNTQTVSYAYDQGTYGVGHLTQTVDSTGTINYSYDVRGRLTTETRQPSTGGTYITSYGYDSNGRLNSLTYPSGRVVNYTLTTEGRISQIDTTYNSVTQTLVNNITYEPFGGVHSFNYGSGTAQSYTRTHDQDGRIASYNLNSQAMNIGYNDNSQIASIYDPTNLPNIANYWYDNLSRLVSYTQGTISQNYGYDANSNRSSKTIGSNSKTYTYGTTSNRLASIQAGGITQSFTQDVNGATTDDGTHQYSYDLRGRLTQTTISAGVINYEVNALGLRVRKQAPYASTDTQYYYDAQGHLIGEKPTSGSQFTREYIYLGNQPVVVLQ